MRPTIAVAVVASCLFSVSALAAPGLVALSMTELDLISAFPRALSVGRQRIAHATEMTGGTAETKLK